MLIAGNIKLLALEPEHIDLLYDWENDINIWRISQTVVPYSKELLQQYISSAQDIQVHGQIRFIISHKDKPVGTIELFDYDPVDARAGVGIMLDNSHRREGIASKSLQIIVKYSKEILLLNQLYCNIIEENTISKRLFEGAGFISTGKKLDWIRCQNGYQSVMFYQLLLNQE